MNAETLRVSCPYCLVGHVEVAATIHNDVVQVPDIRAPRKCATCGRYVALKPRVTIEGVKLEQARMEGRHVA
ncbi:MAG: hypothetical protein AB7E70_20960 [Hyphomicrobiaceae bacterium]